MFMMGNGKIVRRMEKVMLKAILGILYYAKGGSYSGEWKNGKKVSKIIQL